MMQKRRSVPSLLPLSEQDIHRARHQQRKASAGGSTSRRKRLLRKNNKGNAIWALSFGGKLVLSVLSLGLAVVLIQQVVVVQKGGGQQHNNKAEASDAASNSNPKNRKVVEYATDDDEDPQKRKLPLAEYKSLEYALQNAKLVGLYFAASWCPASNAFSAALDSQLNDLFLSPKQEVQQQLLPSAGTANGGGGDAAVAAAPPPLKLEKRHELALVYISSDRTEEEMKEYMGEDRNWFSVPFDSPERVALKKHFLTCAKVELEQLGIERRHEIPTLIIVDGVSHHVLTFSGTKDVTEKGAKGAMSTWQKLHSLSAALDAKFLHADDANAE